MAFDIDLHVESIEEAAALGLAGGALLWGLLLTCVATAVGINRVESNKRNRVPIRILK